MKLAVVCASNQNRSMEAHKLLKEHGYDISSYGTGSKVRLPGPTITKPNIYDFGTPYDYMYEELSKQNAELYTKMGVLDMLDRNRNIKHAPEKFQMNRDEFDLIFTCEERVFDAACDDIINREHFTSKPVHIINVDIIDNREQAAIGGQLILGLAQIVTKADDLDQSVDDILNDYERETNAKLLHTVAFY
ncbi:RNA polymerase II subunit A [Gorgonomyces haynaldii]|nr:RNA polymerase II subunit A [Gorgonomyces haynaldii]